MNEKLAYSIDGTLFGLGTWVRTVKDGIYAIQSCRDAAASALGHFAAQGSDQRFNSSPANISSGRAGEDVVQSSLLRFVHRREPVPPKTLLTEDMIA